MPLAQECDAAFYDAELAEWRQAHGYEGAFLTREVRGARLPAASQHPARHAPCLRLPTHRCAVQGLLNRGARPGSRAATRDVSQVGPVAGPLEGVALLWRAARYQLLSTRSLLFAALPASRAGLPDVVAREPRQTRRAAARPSHCPSRDDPRKPRGPSSMPLGMAADTASWREMGGRGEGAVLALLRHVASGAVLLAAATHLFWDPAWPDVKALQASEEGGPSRRCCVWRGRVSPSRAHAAAEAISLAVPFTNALSMPLRAALRPSPCSPAAHCLHASRPDGCRRAHSLAQAALLCGELAASAQEAAAAHGQAVLLAIVRAAGRRAASAAARCTCSPAVPPTAAAPLCASRRCPLPPPSPRPSSAPVTRLSRLAPRRASGTPL